MKRAWHVTQEDIDSYKRRCEVHGDPDRFTLHQLVSAVKALKRLRTQYRESQGSCDLCQDIRELNICAPACKFCPWYIVTGHDNCVTYSDFEEARLKSWRYDNIGEWIALLEREITVRGE